MLLASPDRLRVQLHFQGGGLAGELVVAQARGGGEDLVGVRGLLRRQADGPGGDDRGPVTADEAGGHPGQGQREPAGQLQARAHQLASLAPGDEQLRRELVVGELPGAAAAGDLAGGRGLELGLAAAGELRGQQRLLPRRPVLQPPHRLPSTRQLVVGQGPDVGDSLLGQRRQDRARAQRVSRAVLAELQADRLPAETVRARHRRQQHRIHVGRVAEADRHRGSLDLPLLRDPLGRLLEHRPAGRAGAVYVQAEGFADGALTAVVGVIGHTGAAPVGEESGPLARIIG